MTSTKEKLIISADVLPHPVSEHGSAEPGRAREGVVMGAKQLGTVYKGPYNIHARRNARQRWAEQIVRDSPRPG